MITRVVKKEVKKKVRRLRGCSDSDTDDDEYEDDLVRRIRYNPFRRCILFIKMEIISYLIFEFIKIIYVISFLNV